MREGHGARSRLAARRTSWWAGRHHHCPCCGSSGKWVPAPGLGCLDSPVPLPLALTGAIYDPACRLPLFELLPRPPRQFTALQRHESAHPPIPREMPTTAESRNGRRQGGKARLAAQVASTPWFEQLKQPRPCFGARTEKSTPSTSPREERSQPTRPSCGHPSWALQSRTCTLQSSNRCWGPKSPL